MPAEPWKIVIWPGAIGECRLETIVEGEREVLRLIAGGDGFTGAVSLVRDLPPSYDVPWFLFPGFFYGQGRTDASLAYPALGKGADEWTAESWDFALDRGAYPVLLARQGNRWTGVDWHPHYVLLDDDGTPLDAGPAEWGETEPQVGCGFSWGDSGGELRLNVPANESPRRHARNIHDSATNKQLWLGPKQVVEVSVKRWAFDGDAHAYQPVLEAVYADLSEDHHAPDPEPDGVLAESAAAGILNWHWIDDPGYMVYTAAYDRSAEFNANNKGVSLGWHFESLGFVGGFPVIFGLAWQAERQGNEQAAEVARRLAKRFCTEAVSDWGFFRTSYHPGRAHTANGDLANPAGLGRRNQDASGDTPFYGACWQGDQEYAHARTTADASLYLARYIGLIDDDDPDRELFLSSLRQSLEAALNVQDDSGRFGQMYDLEKRQVVKREGAGGLLWITAMHHAEPLFDADPAFQERLLSAMNLAGAGYAPDVEAEYICGAPEDVSLAPTSEDGYNAIMAYAALFERTEDPAILELWQRATDWSLTWRKAYNVQFPKKNILGAGDFRCVGGDFASSNNNHLHVYGCNCLADLHRLAHVTGKEFYAKRADDHFAFAQQLLAVVDGQWNGQRGMMTEQFYTNDWSIWGTWDPTAAHRQKGTLMGFSHVWCINMILLGLEQLEQVRDMEL